MSDKTNRLSIYLLKEDISSPKDLLKDVNALKNKNFGPGSTLYWKKSHIGEPKWVKNFFNEENKQKEFLSASSQAVLLIKLKVDSNNFRFFALPFGTGHHLLNSGSIEERFGLRIVLNSVDENLLRSIDKKDMSNIPIQAREQISVNSPVSNFGINIEQDLILGVTGKSKDSKLGQTITGKDALNVAVKVNIDTLPDFLKHCYAIFQRKDYQTNFGWIDQISELRDKPLISELDLLVVDQLKVKNLSKLWMALPEVIDWEDVDGFRYSYNKEAELLDDIFLDSFINGLPNGAEISLDLLKKRSVLCYSKSNDSIIHNWKVYSCLYCEIEHNKKTYILTNGKWYRLEDSFLNVINTEYASILGNNASISLPVYSHKNEAAYNKATALKNGYILMDRKMIPYGGGYNKIEFCDLFSKQNEIIHVKYYGGSSVLSHLFNQGLVSGEILASAPDFRQNVNSKLPTAQKISDKFLAADFKIIYAVVSASKKALDIPFFSKVSIKNAKRRLEALGYSVSLIKIQATSPRKTP